MKTVKYFLFLVALSLAIVACNKKDDTSTPASNTPAPTPKPSWKDTVGRKWTVVKATHNGSDDGSSLGLKLDMRSNGTYTLTNTGHVGTWRFTDSTYTKILLDEASAQLKTTWTIKKISAKRLEVDFNSPFTGGSAHWDMDNK